MYARVAAGPGEGERERRRDRDRPPIGYERRPPRDDAGARAATNGQALWPGDDVHRRGPGHRHDHRADRRQRSIGMTERPLRPHDPPWEMPEFVPPHALEDVPWDRPAEHGWMAPDPDLDALTWNERWNKAAYDPDYPLPPEVARVPRAMAAAAAGSAPRARFGRPVRSPEDVELEDPYDEYAPLADDLQAPGQLAWTGGTVPLYATASVNGSPSHEPSRPPVEPPASPLPAEPPTWSRSSRSVFGDYFAVSGRSAPSLPSPDSGSASRATVPVTRLHRKLAPDDAAGEEWPPVPPASRPRGPSVPPVRPFWSAGSVRVKPADIPEAPPTWVQSPPAPAPRRPPIAGAATATTTASLP